eukprot:TRINITY_DN11341_c0_g1_i2.p2 TRINITY_DN11341_c0_g1~~TRINITY_DN11341_c0_g1_i2.p2  ORF type:complete len:111 (-),score=15.37 TRINITY_DN11341_c0_g1_i2:36-368(-)
MHFQQNYLQLLVNSLGNVFCRELNSSPFISASGSQACIGSYTFVLDNVQCKFFSLQLIPFFFFINKYQFDNEEQTQKKITLQKYKLIIIMKSQDNYEIINAIQLNIRYWI